MLPTKKQVYVSNAWPCASESRPQAVLFLIVDQNEEAATVIIERIGAHRITQSPSRKYRKALRGAQRKPLAEVLANMPNVGKDSDFVREQADRRG